jgi:serine/threonine-protein kinase
MSALRPGDRLGAYRIVEEIGFGGMGVVYRAHDERLGRDVAIKVLAPWTSAEPAAHDALVREAKLASSINHPNVCIVHEVGEAAGQVFIVMELIRGQTLGSIVPEGGLPVSRVLRYGLQIADALGDAHRSGLVHRDLKINNVMITETGLLKVLDFGIAIRADAPPDASADASQGTPAYMAPETIEAGVASGRSDLWSFGVLMYEMCTGLRPFRGHDLSELQTAIRHDEPAPLPARVSPTLRSVITRCLEKDPAMRYGSAGEVRAALEIAQQDSGIREAAVSAPGTAPGPRPGALPRPRRAGRMILATALALAVLGFVVWRATGRQVRGPQREIKSVAVLPLDNLSGDPAQDYFAEGMTEELIAMLARVTPLQVISRTSVMRYKGTQKNVREIARELRVDALVEGSVMRIGDRVRVTAQLIDAASDRHLWSRSYERDMEDVMTLQVDIAHEIVSELHAVLLPVRAESSPRRVNPQAWEATLRGRYHTARRSVADATEAVTQFQIAIDRAPDHASAWAGMATARALLHSFGAGDGDEHLKLAERAADRAIELDPLSADAHSAHGEVSMMLWQWADSERSLVKAIGIQPNHTDGHYWYAQFLIEQGRLKEALREIDLALNGDPMSQICGTSRAEILSSMGRLKEANEEVDRVLKLDPTFERAYLEKLDIMHMQGHLAEAAGALAVMDSLGGLSPVHARRMVQALEQGGPAAYWSEAARQLIAGEGGRIAPAWWVAYCLSNAGQKAEAIEWLSRSLDRHEYPGLLWRWAWKPLRGDPKFEALVKRMGLDRPKPGAA